MSEQRRYYKKHRISLPSDATERYEELSLQDTHIPHLSTVLSKALDSWLVDYELKLLLKDKTE